MWSTVYFIGPLPVRSHLINTTHSIHSSLSNSYSNVMGYGRAASRNRVVGSFIPHFYIQQMRCLLLILYLTGFVQSGRLSKEENLSIQVWSLIFDLFIFHLQNQCSHRRFRRILNADPVAAHDVIGQSAVAIVVEGPGEYGRLDYGRNMIPIFVSQYQIEECVVVLWFLLVTFSLQVIASLNMNGRLFSISIPFIPLFSTSTKPKTVVHVGAQCIDKPSCKGTVIGVKNVSASIIENWLIIIYSTVHFLPRIFPFRVR